MADATHKSDMENGRIVERGTHAKLLEREGAYIQLWVLQQRVEQEK